MRHRHEPFDEEALRNVALPSVKAGPHKHELRRALMQELRGHSTADAGAVSDPSSVRSHVAHPWLPRLGYLLGLLAAAGCVALVISTQWGGGSLFSHRSNSAATTQQGFSAVIGIDANNPPTDQAIQLAAAIDGGNFDLAETLRFKPGGRVYLYRVTLESGDQTIYGCDHVMPTDPLLRIHHAQELQQVIDQGKGHFVAGRRANDGSMIYFYRVGLSDGSEEVYGSDRDPDAGREQLHQSQLDQAMAQSRGELSKIILGPDGTRIFLVKVTLADGTIKTYASPDKPKGK